MVGVIEAMQRVRKFRVEKVRARTSGMAVRIKSSLFAEAF